MCVFGDVFFSTLYKVNKRYHSPPRREMKGRKESTLLISGRGVEKVEVNSSAERKRARGGKS
jgi:hypothetical protein